MISFGSLFCVAGREAVVLCAPAHGAAKPWRTRDVLGAALGINEGHWWRRAAGAALTEPAQSHQGNLSGPRGIGQDWGTWAAWSELCC